MMKRWNVAALSACTALTLGLTACGGDDGGAKTEPVTDQGTIDQGKATATTAVELKAVTGNDSTSQGKIHQVGSSLQSLQGRYQAAKAQAAAGGLPGAGSIPTGLEAAALAQEAAGEVGGVDGASNGTIEFKDGHLTANFKFTAAYGTTNIDYNYIADMMITGETDTNIDGSFDVDFTIAQDLGGAAAMAGQAGAVSGTLNIDYELSASFDAVVVGACPDGSVGGKGGTMTLDYTINYSGEGLTPQYEDALKQSGQAGSGKIVVTYAEDCTVAVEGT